MAATVKPRNGWTEERRERQSRAIRNWAPWRHSTGPRSVEGKVIASRNASKPNSISKQLELLEAEVRRTVRSVKQCMA